MHHGTFLLAVVPCSDLTLARWCNWSSMRVVCVLFCWWILMFHTGNKLGRLLCVATVEIQYDFVPWTMETIRLLETGYDLVFSTNLERLIIWSMLMNSWKKTSAARALGWASSPAHRCTISLQCQVKRYQRDILSDGGAWCNVQQQLCERKCRLALSLIE